MVLYDTYPSIISSIMKKKTLNIIKNDPWLEPYAPAIIGRHNDAVNKELELSSVCMQYTFQLDTLLKRTSFLT